MAKNKDNDSHSDDSMTPEEKLFRVISSGGKDSQDDDSQEDLLETDFFSRIEKLWIESKLLVTKVIERNLQKYWNIRETSPSASASQTALAQVSLKTINKGLTVLVGLLIFYLLTDFILVKTAPGFGVRSGEGVPIVPKSELNRSFREVGSYLEQVKKRNVFSRQAEVQPPEALSPAPSVDNAGMAEAPKGYKLVGISWQGEDFVAIVEVQGIVGATFVRKGDELGEGVEVIEVSPSSVKLSQGGRVWELN